MEREYAVVLHKDVDADQFNSELASATGNNAIPKRTVDCANSRLGSKRITHWMLTDQEAADLQNDPRVYAVEIPPDQRTDIQIGLNRTQRGNFERDNQLFSDRVNWGLRRCIAETNIYKRGTQAPGPYEYAIDGSGVDVVIQDSGIEPGHPEWLDYDGESRLQQIDWYVASGLAGSQSEFHYRDRDSHGTHCAGIAAGLIYGWAKGAHVYSQKLEGLETLQGSDGTGIPIADAFDAIRLWHNAKTNGRPTVVNMSWGYGATITGDPSSGTYRSTSWTYGVDYTTRTQLHEATGVSPNRFGIALGTPFFRMPVRVAVVDAEIEEMIDDGIHVCIAAGNAYHKVDAQGGDDYDNSVVFSGNTYNYHRGSSPQSDRAFMVASIDSGHSGQPPGSDLDKVSVFSERGPGTNIFAPGSDIMSACSNEEDSSYSPAPHPVDSNFQIMNIGGTSMAAPQVAGVCAQHLQLFPDLTPAQLQTRIFRDSKPVIYSTDSSTDYEQVDVSLWGAENKMLYSRYGKQPLTVRNLNIL